MFKLCDQTLELNNSAKKFKRQADADLEKVQTAEKTAKELRLENERLKKDLATMAELKKKTDEQLEEVKSEHLNALEAARSEGDLLVLPKLLTLTLLTYTLW